jgi:hypothetical protein
MEIDQKAAMKALNAAVRERGPSFVYNVDAGCLYSDGEAPSCGVGLALNKLGVDVETLNYMDTCGSNTTIDSVSVRKFLMAQKINLSHQALKVFKAFQHAQDSGKTWGTALRNARRAAKDVG